MQGTHARSQPLCNCVKNEFICPDTLSQGNVFDLFSTNDILTVSWHLLCLLCKCSTGSTRACAECGYHLSSGYYSANQWHNKGTFRIHVCLLGWSIHPFIHSFDSLIHWFIDWLFYWLVDWFIHSFVLLYVSCHSYFYSLHYFTCVAPGLSRCTDCVRSSARISVPKSRAPPPPARKVEYDGRVCAACEGHLKRSDFSTSQWSKGVGIARCSNCVREGERTLVVSVLLG
jgi:hypothetical protein